MRELLKATELKRELLPAAINKAKAEGGSVRIGDGDGLMLVVRPNGAASWVLRYSFSGERRDLTIGRWPVVDLARARVKADEHRLLVHDGVDPMTERKAQREERRIAANPAGGNTRALFDAWIATRDISAVYSRNIEAAFLKDVFPVIGHVPPHQVQRDAVVKIMRTIEGRGAHELVRRLRMWMRQMFDFGAEHEDWPLLTASPVPMGTLKSFKTSRKGRHFPAITKAQDVPALMRKLRSVTDNYVIRNALLLSAHVWQRPTEIRAAAWDEFDLDAAVWRIPAARMKLSDDHLVPLSRQVVAMLRQHQGIVGSEGLLFPGRKYGQSISEGTLTSRLNSMGYNGKHSPHGFRAMARTIGEEVLHIDIRYLEKQLAHEVDRSGLNGAYARAQYWDQRVTMMQAWSDWLDAQT